MKAAVLRGVGEEIEIRDDVELSGPNAGEVRVKVEATGVCHSDLSLQNGTLPTMFPCVPGHEAAGVVTAVGEGVHSVSEGDHVVISWIPPCGTCRFCLAGSANLCINSRALRGGSHLSLAGESLNAGIAGTFAEEMVIPAAGAIRIAEDIPFDIASLVGCGVMTGLGAAMNTAQVVPGSSVVVFGCGGVGINAIQGARLCGAAEIVAVDLVPGKLEMAKKFGASHGVAPDELADLRAEITNGVGFDYAFEVIGLPQTIRAAYDAVRPGGTAVVVGAGRLDAKVEFNALELFYSEKKIVGSLYGSADVRRDFDRVFRLWRAGRIDLEGLVSRRGKLEDLNDAFEAMQKGEVIRTVLEP